MNTKSLSLLLFLATGCACPKATMLPAKVAEPKASAPTPPATNEAAVAEAPTSSKETLNARAITFSGREAKEGTKVQFSRTTRREVTRNKDGAAGMTTTSEYVVAGTIEVLELDDKRAPKAVSVSFLPTSNDAFMHKDASDAAFYAGKKFIVRRGDSGLDVLDEKGKPAFANSSSISFVTGVVQQTLPMSSFSLASRLKGNTVRVSGHADELMGSVPVSIFGKDRSMTLTSEVDGVAVFDAKATNASSFDGKRPDGALPTMRSASNREAHATVEVPTATSEWSRIKFESVSAFESTQIPTGSKSASVTRENVAFTRAFAYGK